MLYWINILKRKILTVKVFNDNSSAVAWVSDRPLKSHNIETVEIQRIQLSMKVLVETLRNDHGCEVTFSHISESTNQHADDQQLISLVEHSSRYLCLHH